MLKETETKETIVFFVTFLSLAAFQLGGTRDACGPPEPSNDTRGQFLICHRTGTLFSDYSDQSLTTKFSRKRNLDQYHTGTSLSSTGLG